jgi:HEAT repeat protein
MLYERYAAPLAALARSGDVAAQVELQRLGQGGLKPLTESLTEGDASEQRVAVALLGELRNPSAVPSLLNLAMAGMPQPGQEPRIVLSVGGVSGGTRPGSDIDLRVDALLAVARLAEPQSVGALVRLTRSHEKQLRLAAYYGLLRLADKLDRATLTQLESTFQEAAPAVKALAVLVLGRASELQGQALSPRLRALLISTLEKRRIRSDETDELFASACAQAIGRSRDKAAVPLLIELLRQGNDEVERQAAWALGRIGDPRAVPPLLRAVFSKSQPIRSAAVAALSRISTAATPAAPDSLPSEKRGLDGIDVARWLADVATQPVTPSPKPAWLDGPGEVSAAIRDALDDTPERVARTLEDLLVLDEVGTPASQALRLGPLQAAPPGGTLPTALSQSVAMVLVPGLRKLVLPTPGTAHSPLVQSAALRVMGQLARSDSPESARATAVLREVLESSSSPQQLLLAASLYAKLPPAQRESQPVFDRLLLHSERWVRLQTLRLASDATVRSLLSPAAIAKAAQDSDGFVREAAQHLK